VNSIFIFFALLAFSVAVTCTYFVRRHRLKKNIFDLPNDRSSHVNPTPRGGGLGIIVAVLLCCIIGIAYHWIDTRLGLLVAFASLCLAGIGWADDAINLRASRKLLGQFATGFIIIAAVNWNVLTLSNLFLGALGLLVFVWLTNLYNFMDGIDGIAGVQTMVACVGSLIIFPNDQTPFGMNLILVSLLAASAGFLVFNWPPASIFMGDVGSATIGAIFATLILAQTSVANINALEVALVWFILLSPFVMDATLTLLRRAIRGDRLSQAHRSHAYQRAARYLQSHKKVTLAYGMFGLVFCIPMAIVAKQSSFASLLAGAITVLVEVCIFLYFGAGSPDNIGKHRTVPVANFKD
jgi:Fuc2NAc and GlcNAc transferase